MRASGGEASSLGFRSFDLQRHAVVEHAKAATQAHNAGDIAKAEFFVRRANDAFAAAIKVRSGSALPFLLRSAAARPVHI